MLTAADGHTYSPSNECKFHKKKKEEDELGYAWILMGYFWLQRWHRVVMHSGNEKEWAPAMSLQSPFNKRY